MAINLFPNGESLIGTWGKTWGFFVQRTKFRVLKLDPQASRILGSVPAAEIKNENGCSSEILFVK